MSFFFGRDKFWYLDELKELGASNFFVRYLGASLVLLSCIVCRIYHSSESLRHGCLFFLSKTSKCQQSFSLSLQRKVDNQRIVCFCGINVRDIDAKFWWFGLSLSLGKHRPGLLTCIFTYKARRGKFQPPICHFQLLLIWISLRQRNQCWHRKNFTTRVAFPGTLLVSFPPSLSHCSELNSQWVVVQFAVVVCGGIVYSTFAWHPLINDPVPYI